MWLAIEAVKKGEADVAVSAGNTGALMAMSKFYLKTMAGIERPAIAAIWPTLRGESVVLDLGATHRRGHAASARHGGDGKRDGAHRARHRASDGRLLNIGVEEVKGLDEVREAGQLLRERDLPYLEYDGFVEGDDIGKGTVDVVVTEGFAGNIALKTPKAPRARSPAICAAQMSANDLDEDRLSVRARRVSHACGEDGSAPVQWRRVSRVERHGHQEPWRRRRGGFRRRN